MPAVALNQATFEACDTPALLAAAAGAGIAHVGLWRHKLAPHGPAALAFVAADHGVAITSLCRGGFFTAPTAAGRRAAVHDTCTAIEQTATLGAPVLVLVCGPAHDGDLAGARATIARALEDVVPVAAEHGVRLAIEPFHPVFAADRSAVVTLGQALDLAAPHDPDVVGVALDTFHVWWDPDLDAQLARAAGRVATLQLGDWPAVMGVPLRGRVLPGDGLAPLARVVAGALAGGYDGPVEVEVLSEEVWARPADEVARDARVRTERVLADAAALLSVEAPR